jgi:hypothetical protein
MTLKKIRGVEILKCQVTLRVIPQLGNYIVHSSGEEKMMKSSWIC